jgi:hypothetical protein
MTSFPTLPPDASGAYALDTILKRLPASAKTWLEGLSWQQRRYILSLCHLMCATSPEVQAEFLDEYTADGLVSRKLEDRETRQRVEAYLAEFRIETQLTEALLRRYIRQFYIHSAQDAHRQPELYLESALRLVLSTEERNNVFNYVLGFELMNVMFRMSWLHHERLYRLQRNQDDFITTYIKPIQHTHRVNGIIVPKDAKVFFAKRNYFVQIPEISDRKLTELVMATFTTDAVSHLGFTMIRHPQSLIFDYECIFQPEQDLIFP